MYSYLHPGHLRSRHVSLILAGWELCRTGSGSTWTMWDTARRKINTTSTTLMGNVSILVGVYSPGIVCGRPANLSASNAWKMAKKMVEMLGKRVKCLETAVASPAARVHMIEFFIH